MRFDVETIVQNGLCTGCGLCEGVTKQGVVMRINAAGFLRPQRQRKLAEDEIDLLSKSCPAIVVDGRTREGPRHPLWGPTLQTFTGHATNSEFRFTGSSGGVLSAMAAFLLRSGRVQGVIQTVADPEHPTRNVTRISTTEDEVLRAAGSRYSPAAPLTHILEWLDRPGTLAFIGKPCDVSALRLLLKEHPHLKEKVPYVLSFMCAGTPSAHATSDLLDVMGVQSTELASFRYRGEGWPGEAKAVKKNGETATLSYARSWGDVLGKQLQFRCKICPDGVGELADITCADGWATDGGYPDFDEQPGISLAISRTKAGRELLGEAANAGAVSLDELNVRTIASMQPYQVTRKSMVLARMVGAYCRLGVMPKFVGLGLLRAALHCSPLAWVRNAVGSYRRASIEVQ